MLRTEDAVLVVVDVQERLLPFIHDSEFVVGQIVRLIRGFQIVQAPILVTEQYRRGLGPTAPEIIDALQHPLAIAPVPQTPGSPKTPPASGPPPQMPPAADDGPAVTFEPIEKMTFSCAAHGEFLSKLAETRRRQVVLCGIESHVCVLQTALHLAEDGVGSPAGAGNAAARVGQGWEVYLAADAVSSRSPRNVEIALRRMEQAGVRLTSVEMAIFEMLHACGTPEFKSWSRVIR